MQERDGRSIPDAALEVLRERAVAMLEAGNSQRAIAAALGVHKNTVCRWLKGWRVAGAAGLKAKKRGRRLEAKRLLDAAQAAEVQRLMIRTPRTSSTYRMRSGAGRRCASWSRPALGSPSRGAR